MGDFSWPSREGFVAAFGREVPTSIGMGRQVLAELLGKDGDIRAVFCNADGLAQAVVSILIPIHPA